MLGLGLAHRAPVRDRPPQPCAERAADEGVDDRRERRIAAGSRDHPMELGVGVDERLEIHVGLALEDAIDDAQNPIELHELLVGEAGGSPRDALCLEHAPHGEEVGRVRGLLEVGEESQWAEEGAWVERRDVGAVALAGLEHAERRERAHALAKRSARDAQLSGELLLDGEARSRAQISVRDHVLDAVDHDVGLRTRTRRRVIVDHGAQCTAVIRGLAGDQSFALE